MRTHAHTRKKRVKENNLQLSHLVLLATLTYLIIKSLTNFSLANNLQLSLQC